LSELSLTARLPVASCEAECQAKVHQLNDGKELVRGLPQLAELLKELISAARAMMKGCHQCLITPVTAGAPRAVQYHVIDAGAQRVVRRAHLIHSDTRVASPKFEAPQTPKDALAQGL
jgi:hypothetical protein